MMRLARHDAIMRWPIGSQVGIAIAGHDAVAFPMVPG
jgi:hypothetical protein